MKLANTIPTVSIVIATHARRSKLQHCIRMIREIVSIPHEIIVVGGGGDGTEEWLAGQSDLHYIRETHREGATKAYNKGFRAASGKYVMWLNDDSYPLANAVESAVDMLERDQTAQIGMIAFYHNESRERNKLDTIHHDSVAYSIYNVRGLPYANFGLLPRNLLHRLDYLDERFFFCAWDPDLSLKVQRVAGLRVVGCRQALIHHDELLDDRKRHDMTIIEADNARLFAKWLLPQKDAYPDPKPEYQRMVAELVVS
ncbi:MAG: glycosyltransferase [Planctomycetota bacterium]